MKQLIYGALMIIFFLLHLGEPLTIEDLKTAYILKAAFFIMACVFANLFSKNIKTEKK